VSTKQITARKISNARIQAESRAMPIASIIYDKYPFVSFCDYHTIPARNGKSRVHKYLYSDFIVDELS
jgi:hypothetical protein